MQLMDGLKSRRAVRRYSPREVETDTIGRLLEAATWAPNDRLREPWHFYVMVGEAKKRYEELVRRFMKGNLAAKPESVNETMRMVESTLLVIVATSDIVPGDAASSEDNDYAAACAIHCMWLAAQELDLGMVWRTRGIGMVRDERLYRFIGAPEDKKIIGTLYIGYPENGAPATIRTPFTEKTTWL